MKTTKFIASTFVAAALAASLAACSSDTNETATVTPAPSVVTAEPAPEATEPAAVETPEAVLAPEVDEYSQVVDGVVFTGTEAAPVRIGTDTPGAAPAVEAQMIVIDGKSENAEALATDADKYLVLVWNSEEQGGYVWKVFGMSPYGSFRDRANSFDLPAFASADAAIASGFMVDGRTLDRAEFLLLVR